MVDVKKITIVLTLALGLLLTGYPDALGLIGLSISPGVDPNFSDQTYLAKTYRGYEIWKDPARAGRGEYIIYTPPGVIPVISSIKYELAAAKRTIDSRLDAYNNPPPPPALDPEYTVTFTAGPGGSIDPSGSVTYVENTRVWVKATPDPGYEFEKITRDGAFFHPEALLLYEVTGSVEIAAHFTPVETSDPSDPGDDSVDDVEDQVDQMAEGLPRIYARGAGLALMAVAFVKGKEELLSLRALLG